VALVDGFTPVAGDAFDILDWTTLDGAFAALELPALAGLRWDVSQLYDSGSLAVAPLYEADFDSNGRVDAADLALWRAGFSKDNAGRADGDATGDQLVTGEDFLVWQRQLGLGVASLPATTAVPEPASALVLAGAIAGLIARRRSR
jgi:hypothetical protein